MADDTRLAGFDADAVRTGLRLAMQVGLPVDAASQPVFYMPPTSSSTGATDAEGVPFDPAARRTFVAPTAVRNVKCAIEYVDGEGKLENFGVIVPARVILTLLDEEYARVKGFAYVVIGGSRYFYRRTEVPRGLVSIGVFKVHCVSEDEG